MGKTVVEVGSLVKQYGNLKADDDISFESIRKKSLLFLVRTELERPQQWRYLNASGAR